MSRDVRKRVSVNAIFLSEAVIVFFKPYFFFSLTAEILFSKTATFFKDWKELSYALKNSYTNKHNDLIKLDFVKIIVVTRQQF